MRSKQSETAPLKTVSKKAHAEIDLLQHE